MKLLQPLIHLGLSCLQVNMMAAQSIVCQAMPVNRPTPNKAAPQQTGPLARPAGFSQVTGNLIVILSTCRVP